MRTTLNLDEELYHRAVEATGIKEKTKLIHLGLQTLVRQAAYRRLAKLGGTIPEAKAAPRRRYKW